MLVIYFTVLDSTHSVQSQIVQRLYVLKDSSFYPFSACSASKVLPPFFFFFLGGGVCQCFCLSVGLKFIMIFDILSVGIGFIVCYSREELQLQRRERACVFSFL